MSISCKQCGAELAEGKAFCTKCGARRSEAQAAAGARRFCTKCGAAVAGETKFCTKCGASTALPSAASAPKSSGAAASVASSGATTGIGAQAAAPDASRAKSLGPRGIPKIAFIGGGVAVLVLIVFVVAGMISAARRAREKAQETEAAQKFEKSLEKLASSAKSAPPSGNNASLANVEKNLNDLANAANALGQNAEKQGGASPGGMTGPAPSAPPAPGSPAAIAAASAAADAALTPPPIPGANIPIVPVAATGNQAHDWALEYERTVGGPEADLVVRTGDINNLGYGWPPGFDPFSGQSTPIHPQPNIDHIPPNAPPGTDRVMIGTGVTPVHMSIRHTEGKPDQIVVDAVTNTTGSDGYSGNIYDCYMIRNRLPPEIAYHTMSSIHLPPGVSADILQVAPYDAAKCTRERQLTMPTPIVLPVGALPSKINAVVFQIFADDFQSPVYGSHFQVSINGTRIPTFEYAINSLNQSGPIGKLVTLRLLPEYWPLLKSGEVKLLFDDPTTHKQDGYAVDFVRILVNPRNFKYQVSLTATVTDASTLKPITGATVSAGLTSTTTDRQGKCELTGIPAGLVVATANAAGYDENSVPVDLQAGQTGNANIQLRRHQENAAALEQSIAQTGSATIYGIHFDTGSSKLRADSLPALRAILALIKAHAGSHWIISGHTDNQGSDKLNIPLSKARAASVITWLTAHGVAANRLQPQGFGSTRPVADNSTANGRFLNRRVEIALAK